jgi:hypothetical protein
MYVRIVTFGLTVSHDEYAALAEQVAPAFAAWPGLQAKYWIADQDANEYGGVYVFDSQQAADASRETELYQALAANPAFTDPQVVEYDVLAAPTAVTAVLPVSTPVV